MGVVENYAGLLAARLFLGVAGNAPLTLPQFTFVYPSKLTDKQRPVSIPVWPTTSPSGIPVTGPNSDKPSSSAQPVLPVHSPDF